MPLLPIPLCFPLTCTAPAVTDEGIAAVIPLSGAGIGSLGCSLVGPGTQLSFRHQCQHCRVRAAPGPQASPHNCPAELRRSKCLTAAGNEQHSWARAPLPLPTSLPTAATAQGRGTARHGHSKSSPFLSEQQKLLASAAKQSAVPRRSREDSGCC